MVAEKIDRIKKIGKNLRPETPQNLPNKDQFEALMQKREIKTENAQPEYKELPKNVNEQTLFDEFRNLNQKVDSTIRLSPNELAHRADDVVSQIDILKNKLETPDLELKNSVQTVLRNKLTHIDESLKVALERAGLEYIPPEKPTSLAKPLDRFLGLLTHSQSQLQTISEDVRSMAAMGRDHLTPANMLLIQIKVGYIQQEIELFTSMLNKTLESVKTLGNVQV